MIRSNLEKKDKDDLFIYNILINYAMLRYLLKFCHCISVNPAREQEMDVVVEEAGRINGRDQPRGLSRSDSAFDPLVHSAVDPKTDSIQASASQVARQNGDAFIGTVANRLDLRDTRYVLSGKTYTLSFCPPLFFCNNPCSHSKIERKMNLM